MCLTLISNGEKMEYDQISLESIVCVVDIFRNLPEIFIVAILDVAVLASFVISMVWGVYAGVCVYRCMFDE